MGPVTVTYAGNTDTFTSTKLQKQKMVNLRHLRLVLNTVYIPPLTELIVKPLTRDTMYLVISLNSGCLRVSVQLNIVPQLEQLASHVMFRETLINK